MVDYIKHTSYANLPSIDLQWDTGMEIPHGDLVIHVPTDHIAEFFRTVKRSKSTYVVVSSNSDYSIEEQSKNPVEVDMQKWMRFINTSGIGYNQLNIPARCDVEKCLKSDKYSVKIYSWTKDTFNKIPDNIVCWFCTNCNIDDERIVRIPFGVPEQSIPFLSVRNKDKFQVYCNWQNNTIERDAIKKEFARYPHSLIENEVPTEHFINSVQSSPFVIAPPGNGLDSYRILESLYCGSIPVIANDIWSKAYNNLPVIRVNNYAGIYDSLKNLWETTEHLNMFDLNDTAADLKTWELLIRESRELL